MASDKIRKRLHDAKATCDESVIVAGMGPDVPGRRNIANVNASEDPWQKLRRLRSSVGLNFTEGVTYVRERLDGGHRKNSRPQRPDDPPLSWPRFFFNNVKSLVTMNYRGLPGRLFMALQKEYQETEQRAARGIRESEDGKLHLPDYGISYYTKTIYLLQCMPKHRLSYQSVIMLFICCLSLCRMCIAWTLFIWMLIEGYSAYNMLKKCVCTLLHLPYQEQVDPAFILNPEVETVAWLNNLTSRLWLTCLSKFVESDVRAVLNTKLDSLSTSFENHKYLKHLKPHILELDIGEQVPWITALKSYSSEINLLNSNDESLTLDIGIILHIKPKILVSLNEHLSFGIHELKISAPVRLRFIPLLRDETIFGEVQFSFLRLPDLNYNTSGVLGFLSMPLIKPSILYIIHEALKYALHPHKIVLPNPVVDDLKLHSLRISEPLGVLRINMKEGEALTPIDVPIACIWAARSDPYCILRLGTRAEKTSVIKKNLNPVWNHLCEFPITAQDYEYRELKVYAMDFEWGFWREDDELGFCTISVEKVVKKKRVDEIYRLGGGSDEGTLRMLIQFIPVHPSIPRTLRIPADHRVSQAIFSVLVYEVQMSHLCTPMIVFEVSGRDPATTTPGRLSENWEFAEEFFFPIHNTDTDKVTISLVDYDAKVTVKVLTKKICNTIKDFIADADDPQAIKEYNRERHYLLGEKTMDIMSFSGYKQEINLESGEGGIYHVLLIAKLHYLETQKIKISAVEGIIN